MGWTFLADAFAVLHGLNVAFVILGPIFAWRSRWVRSVHLVDLWWNFFVASSGEYCPMTSFENALRTRYDPAHAYASSFILHYISPMLWWDLTQRHIVIAMTMWAIGWTVIYAWLWARKGSRPNLSA